MEVQRYYVKSLIALLFVGVLVTPAYAWGADAISAETELHSPDAITIDGDGLNGVVPTTGDSGGNMESGLQSADGQEDESIPLVGQGADGTENNEDGKTFIVSFDLAGGHLASTGALHLEFSVKTGNVVSRPEEPIYRGRTFLGWYAESGSPFDFNTPIIANTKITARWSQFTGWNESKTAWFDDGVMARSHCFFDPGSNAWYWADADGSIAAGKDVFIPKDESDRTKGGKWVRFEDDRTMVKGEDLRYGGWYYFDPVTGEMAKGFGYVRESGKWCYYDPMTGKMQYGERAIDGGWYYLTPGTGAVDYEWAWLPGSDKWVYYDEVTGRMVHGARMVEGKPYYLDDISGRRLNKNEIVSKLVRVVQSSYGTHPDCPAELKAAGGDLCPYGPCMSYVWWCFHHAGLDIFLNNDEIRTGWPHKSLDWYRSHGRVDRKASQGDIAFFNPTDWAHTLGVSSNHAGIVVGTTPGGILIADAAAGGIMPRLYSWSNITGIAHPYY